MINSVRQRFSHRLLAVCTTVVAFTESFSVFYSLFCNQYPSVSFTVTIFKYLLQYTAYIRLSLAYSFSDGLIEQLPSTFNTVHISLNIYVYK